MPVSLSVLLYSTLLCSVQFSSLLFLFSLLILAFSVNTFLKLTNVTENSSNIKSEFTGCFLLLFICIQLSKMGGEICQITISELPKLYLKMHLITKCTAQTHTFIFNTVHFIQIPFYIIWCLKMFSFCSLFFCMCVSLMLFFTLQITLMEGVVKTSYEISFLR